MGARRCGALGERRRAPHLSAVLSDVLLRPLILAAGFMLLAGLEASHPWRHVSASRRERWPGSALLFAIGSALSRLVLPAGLVGLALLADDAGIGLFNLIDLPPLVTALGALILLDLAVWAQHVALHHVPFLWRLHRVHHADPHLDVMSALRFHPGEFLVSLAWKGAIVVALGVPASVVLVFEILLNLFAMLTHANLALPPRLDAAVRRVFVTPDMHRIHHSVMRAESNTNFGFCLSFWDRLAGLYTPEAARGRQHLRLGQEDWRSARDQRLPALLTQPLRRPAPQPPSPAPAGSGRWGT